MKKTDPQKRNKRQVVFSLLTIAFLGGGVLLYFHYFESQIGPEQPIPFSHMVHAKDKEISCFFCHDGAPKTARAGVPPVETCILCHDRIIIHHPEIEKLRAHYREKKPIEWVKVNEMPDFVFFNHSVHLHRKIDCSECHGNVKMMDRIEMKQEFKMNFCVDCHRKENATTDCFTCHR